ncbi:MAG: AAA family ATPase, partial [Bdellovibrionia bacterium]
MMLLEKTPEDRYQTIYGVLKDLEYCKKELSRGKKMDSFEPGQFDFTDRLEVPQKLYGRENETRTILNTFEKCCTGTVELVLVSGFSGIGKTELVREVLKPLARERGHFIAGKFELLKKDIPYFAIAQALDGWVDQVLQESEAQLENWKLAIQNSLGNSVNWLTSVAPSLELIVGKQPSMPALSPAEMQVSLGDSIRNFMYVLATKEHPLVMFLDDCQWTDSASISLIKALLASKAGGYFCFVASYRSNEVSPAHPFFQSISEVKKGGVCPTEINLDSISQKSISELLRDTFRNRINNSEESLLELSSVVYRRTKGNPFFIRQILKDFYGKGGLHFDYEKGWGWDFGIIDNLNVRSDVAEFLLDRLNVLKQGTRETLKRAALIGNTFTVEKIRLISKDSPKDIFHHLRLAMEEGFVERIGATFKFGHDKLKEASYALWREEEAAEVHFDLGLKIYQGAVLAHKDPMGDESAIEIINHWKSSGSVMRAQSADQKKVFVALSVQAAQKAKNCFAFEAAEKFLEVSAEFLPDIQDESILSNHLLLRLEIIAYLAKYDAFEAYFRDYLSIVTDPIARGKAYKIRVYVLNSTSRFEECVQYVSDVLREFGLAFPKKATQFHVLLEIIKSIQSFSKSGLQRFAQIPVMTDETKKVALDIVSESFEAVYFVSKNLMGVWAFKVARLCFRYGGVKGLPFSLSIICIIIGAGLKNFRWAAEIARTGRKLAKNFDLNSLSCRTEGMFESTTDVFVMEPEQYFEASKLCLRYALETGDRDFLGWTLTVHLSLPYYTSRPINEMVTEKILDLAKMVGSYPGLVSNNVKLHLQFYQNLHQTNIPNVIDGSFLSRNDAEKYVSDHPEGNFPGFFYGFECAFFYFFDHEEEAIRTSYLAKKYIIENPIGPLQNFAEFFIGLNLEKSIRIAELRKDRKAKKRALKVLKSVIADFKAWEARANPNLFRARHLLLKGVWAKVHGKNPTPFYVSGIREAKRLKYLGIEAIGWKLRAEWESSHGDPQTGEIFIRQAIEIFKKWGAHSIVSHLIKKHGSQPSSSQVVPLNSSALDLQSMMKASISLFEEVELDRLHNRLIRVVMENAGAQECWIFHKIKDEWRLATYSKHNNAIATESTLEKYRNKRIAEIKEVSQKVIEYVIRSQKPIITEDTLHSFIDPDFARTYEVKSLLCIPILSKSQVIAILYLEHKNLPGAFTQARVYALTLLGGQMAVSLENAALYSKLKAQMAEIELKDRK